MEQSATHAAGAASPGLSRRTLMKGAAWGVPAVAVAVATPVAAASCIPVSIVIDPGQTTAPDDQTLVLTGTDTSGTVYTITVTSTHETTTTTIGQSRPGDSPIPYTSYNLNTAGNGWNGGIADDGSQDYPFPEFAPGAGVGAIVLNQRGAVDPEPTGTIPLGADLQTLTFTFEAGGASIDPTNLVMDVFDITSGKAEEGWRQNYWDAVGFSVTPSSIAYMGTAAYGQGDGAGTLADPYRRTDQEQPTDPDGTVTDRFVFASFPSGSQLQYTNYNDLHGWHFISISGIRFDAESCA